MINSSGDRWNERFLGTTRGRVVSHLRRGALTVSELASLLDLTDNAVRAHLATLGRDGLVREVGKRPSTRRPEVLYGLTAEAELLFPKAYDLLLNVLLDGLSERLTAEEIEYFMRDAGRRIAAMKGILPRELSLRERAAGAVQLLGELGGLGALEEGDAITIRGFSCPMAGAAAHHVEICQLAEELLSEFIGAPVTQRCERSGEPRCVFVVG